MDLVDDAPAPEMGHNLPPQLTLGEQLIENNAKLAFDVERLAERANATPKEIKAPADLDAVGTLVADARELWKKADKSRESDKAPYLAAEREIQSFYAVFLDRLKRIETKFQKVGNDYQAEVARKARVAAEQAAAAARAEEQRQRDLAEAQAAANRPAATIKHEARADAAADRAIAAETTATAKAADLTRVRTDSGLLASARSEWKGTITDLANIDLIALRPYLKREAIEAALNQAVRMGIREIKGAEIRQETKANFRR